MSLYYCRFLGYMSGCRNTEQTNSRTERAFNPVFGRSTKLFGERGESLNTGASSVFRCLWRVNLYFCSGQDIPY